MIYTILIFLVLAFLVWSINNFLSPYGKAVEKLAYAYLEVEKSLSASAFMKWKTDELQLNRSGVDYRDIEKMAEKIKSTQKVYP